MKLHEIHEVNVLDMDKDFFNNKTFNNQLNVGICEMHGGTDSNCAIKLKKNQSILINYFSNIFVSRYGGLKDNENKEYPKFSLWSNILQDYTNCLQINNYNDCLNNVINSLSLFDLFNSFGLYTGNEIDYKKLGNDKILTKNLSINYIPNIQLYRDSNGNDNVQHFYNYTHNKVYFFRNKIYEEEPYYIMNLEELIYKYYENKEFILIITACRNNDLELGFIQNGLFVNPNFNINNYLLSDEEKTKITNFKQQIMLEKAGDNEFFIILDNLNNNDIKIWDDFSFTNNFIERVLNEQKLKNPYTLQVDLILYKNIDFLLNRCKHQDYIHNLEFHINYALFEILYLNIFMGIKYTQQKENKDTMAQFNLLYNLMLLNENIYKDLFGHIFFKLKNIFKSFLNNTIDIYLFNKNIYIFKIIFMLSNMLIINFEINLQITNLYSNINIEKILNDLEIQDKINLNNFKEYINIIISAVNDTDILKTENDFTNLLNKHKNILTQENSKYNIFDDILLVFYTIVELITDDVYKMNKIQKDYINNMINNDALYSIINIIFKYITKLILYQKNVASKDSALNININIIDEIFDKLLEAIILLYKKKYYTVLLYYNLIENHKTFYYNYVHEQKQGFILYLYNKIQEDLQKFKIIVNSFNYAAINNESQFLKYIKYSYGYDTSSSCFLYKFISMLKNKLFYVKSTGNCYNIKKINDFSNIKKWIPKNMIKFV